MRLPSFADSHIGDYYRLPDGLDYPRADVLNLNFLKGGWRLPSTRVVGVLCALSDAPIPDEFKHGALIPVVVRFFDRAGQQLAKTTVTLWADRLTHHPRIMQRGGAGRQATEVTDRRGKICDSTIALAPLSTVTRAGKPTRAPQPCAGRQVHHQRTRSAKAVTDWFVRRMKSVMGFQMARKRNEGTSRPVHATPSWQALAIRSAGQEVRLLHGPRVIRSVLHRPDCSQASRLSSAVTSVRSKT